MNEFIDVSSLRTQCFESMKKAGFFESSEGEKEPVFAYIDGKRMNLSSQCCKISGETRFDIFWSDFSPKLREFTYLENRGLSELLESRASILQKINQKKEEETPQINSIDSPLFPQFPNLTKRNLLIAGVVLLLYGVKVLLFGK